MVENCPGGELSGYTSRIILAMTITLTLIMMALIVVMVMNDSNDDYYNYDLCCSDGNDSYDYS